MEDVFGASLAPKTLQPRHASVRTGGQSSFTALHITYWSYMCGGSTGAKQQMSLPYADFLLE